MDIGIIRKGNVDFGHDRYNHYNFKVFCFQS